MSIICAKSKNVNIKCDFYKENLEGADTFK